MQTECRNWLTLSELACCSNVAYRTYARELQYDIQKYIYPNMPWGDTTDICRKVFELLEANVDWFCQYCEDTQDSTLNSALDDINTRLNEIRDAMLAHDPTEHTVFANMIYWFEERYSSQGD